MFLRKRDRSNDGYLRVKGEDANAFLYFIGEPFGEGPIKIGYSAWPQKRLYTIQISSPVELAILAKVWCLSQWEKELHDVFKDSRVRGEWFRRTPKLMRVVDAAARKDFGGVVNILYEQYEPTAHDAIIGADQFLLVTDDGQIVDATPHEPVDRRLEMRAALKKSLTGHHPDLADTWIEPD